MSDNVLLHLGEEPRFDQIKTEDIKPALQTAIAEAREQIAAIKAQTHTDWANTVEKTDRHYRTRRPHLERGFPSQLRGRYARAACRIQRTDA